MSALVANLMSHRQGIIKNDSKALCSGTRSDGLIADLDVKITETVDISLRTKDYCFSFAIVHFKMMRRHPFPNNLHALKAVLIVRQTLLLKVMGM
jgi:hypothetical protein